eukprot:scaffold2191_cov254-Pinguiococcus_pyrenoidosus.AAC.33
MRPLTRVDRDCTPPLAADPASCGGVLQERRHQRLRLGLSQAMHIHFQGVSIVAGHGQARVNEEGGAGTPAHVVGQVRIHGPRRPQRGITQIPWHVRSTSIDAYIIIEDETFASC